MDSGQTKYSYIVCGTDGTQEKERLTLYRHISYIVRGTGGTQVIIKNLGSTGDLF